MKPDFFLPAFTIQNLKIIENLLLNKIKTTRKGKIN